MSEESTIEFSNLLLQYQRKYIIFHWKQNMIFMFFLFIKLTQMIQHMIIVGSLFKIMICWTLIVFCNHFRKFLLIINLAGLIYLDLYIPCSDIIHNFTLSFYQTFNIRILGYQHTIRFAYFNKTLLLFFVLGQTTLKTNYSSLTRKLPECVKGILCPANAVNMLVATTEHFVLREMHHTYRTPQKMG